MNRWQSLTLCFLIAALWVVQPGEACWLPSSSYPSIADFCSSTNCFGDCLGQTTIMCAGDHYPRECCDAAQRLLDCQFERFQRCGFTNGDNIQLSSAALIQYTRCGGVCLEAEMKLPPFWYEGCDNELLCTCRDANVQASWPCQFSDNGCRCPIAETYLDCIQSEVEACDNEELDEEYSSGRAAVMDVCPQSTGLNPSSSPSAGPSAEGSPSSAPSAVPGFEPRSEPSSTPSLKPIADPSAAPSALPSTTPRAGPSAEPSLPTAGETSGQQAASHAKKMTTGAASVILTSWLLPLLWRGLI